MRAPLTTVETGGHLAAAAYLMNHADQSAMVVVNDAHRPVAIVTEADLLRAVAHGAETGSDRVEDWMSPVWTAGGPADLDRCAEFLRERGALSSRTDSDGVDVVTGRDPDGLPVLITYPGPDQAPRHVISRRVYG